MIITDVSRQNESFVDKIEKDHDINCFLWTFEIFKNTPNMEDKSETA